MSTSTKSKAATLAMLQAFILGLQKVFPSGQFTLGNAPFTTATLVQALQSLIDAIVAVNSAQASAKVAVSQLQATRAKVGPVVLALKRNLLSQFGNAADVLAQFSLEPRKVPAPRTAEQLAASKAKAASTRKARGTVGPKKRLTVTGNVTGVEIVPVTAPEAASPPAQPAPVAPAAPPPGGSVGK